MDNIKQYLKALLMLICLFSMLIFSISQIINMAKPASHADTIALVAKQENAPLSSQVNMLIHSQNQLSYKDVQNKLSKITTYHPTSPTVLMDRFNIGPELEKLPANEQDYTIRLKLLDWKFKDFQTRLEEARAEQEQPLILKTWFWLYSIIIWASSIIGGRILNHYTDKFLSAISGEKNNWGLEKDADIE